MKANELRIGNLVKANGVYGGSVQTFERFTDDLSVMFFSDGRGIGEYLKDCGPVAITEEWLKRIDWKGYIHLHFNSNFSMDKQGHIYYHNDYTGVNVSYIHELQNLYFALKGEELILKDLTKDRPTISEIMDSLEKHQRRRWCEGGVCACIGCANNALTKHGYNREDFYNYNNELK